MESIRPQLHTPNSVLTSSNSKNCFHTGLGNSLRAADVSCAMLMLTLFFLLLLKATEFKGAFLSPEHLRQELLKIHRKSS